jgi:crotonobetainyl-CoA:carnitine CoA-transferase CaiB-like acyl-CoA transferase
VRQALDDITVLDLSHALAGPFASTMLAGYGADVIKIETPGTGDISRAWGPPFYQGESAYFVNLNPNKKSVEIDLKHPEGRELFLRLVANRTTLVCARGALVECDHPVAGRIKVVGPPVKLSDTPGSVREAAPLLGQHTRVVLRSELGLAEEEIDRLQSAGAIGGRVAGNE